MARVHGAEMKRRSSHELSGLSRIPTGDLHRHAGLAAYRLTCPSTLVRKAACERFPWSPYHARSHEAASPVGCRTPCCCCGCPIQSCLIGYFKFTNPVGFLWPLGKASEHGASFD